MADAMGQVHNGPECFVYKAVAKEDSMCDRHSELQVQLEEALLQLSSAQLIIQML
jgi:hypothetical protein